MFEGIQITSSGIRNYVVNSSFLRQEPLCQERHHDHFRKITISNLVSVFGMTINFIPWIRSNFVTQGNLESPFHIFAFPSLSQSGNTRCIRYVSRLFFAWALLLIVHTWISSALRSNLLRLKCTCCTVPTISGRSHGSPLVWSYQWPSSQPLSSPQLSHNDSLWA